MPSVTMPQLGESVTEGTIAKWLKREGDTVSKYEPLVEVITDKVNSEIPSPAAGVVARITVPEGQTVKVGTEIAVVAAPDEQESRAGGPAQPAIDAAAGSQEMRAARPEERPGLPGDTGEPAAVPPGPLDGPRYTADELRRRSSPLVRRLAKEHGIDLQQVHGTGTGGRVTKDDMLAYIAAAQGRPPAVPVAGREAAAARLEPAEPVPAGPPTPAPDEEVLPATPMRRAIAEHMVRSVTTAPHAWTYIEVDVAGLVNWREHARLEFQQREGFDLSYVPFVCKALVETLREHPRLNSTWRDGQVVLKRRIHLGVAVALEDGLVVPVIRDADEKSIAGLARTLHDLVTRARAGKLTPEEVQAGTFTLNNTGALGSMLSMPIINQPQAAILTMEAITKRVVVTADDAIAVRPVLNVCLSFDHRVCDGLLAGRFLQSLKMRLQAMAPGGSV